MPAKPHLESFNDAGGSDGIDKQVGVCAHVIRGWVCGERAELTLLRKVYQFADITVLYNSSVNTTLNK